jgi:hypothetical protein
MDPTVNVWDEHHQQHHHPILPQHQAPLEHQHQHDPASVTNDHQQQLAQHQTPSAAYDVAVTTAGPADAGLPPISLHGELTYHDPELQRLSQNYTPDVSVRGIFPVCRHLHTRGVLASGCRDDAARVQDEAETERCIYRDPLLAS